MINIKNEISFELYYHISINKFNQFKIFEDEQGIYGFVIGHIFNKSTEKHYQQTSKIYKNNGIMEIIYGYTILFSQKEKEKYVNGHYNYFKNY